MIEALSTRILAHHLGGEDALSSAARADDALSAAGDQRFLAARLEAAPRCSAGYASFVIRLIPALGILLLTAGARAHESSSQHFKNISESGTQASVVARTAARPTARKTAPGKFRRAAAAPPAASISPIQSQAVLSPERARGDKTPWLVALALALVAGAIAYRRLAGAHQRAADELQSPLAAIESYLDLMASEARLWFEDLSCMRTTTARLRRLITDILDMTRVSDGRMKLSVRPVNLAEIVGECVDAYAPQAASRGVSLASEVPAGLAAALADPDRLRQVLDNLIGNAIKFTPVGRGVTVAGRDERENVVVEVRDEGVGVPADRRARLFGKFQRLSSALDGTKGTGLGLHLSQRLVAAQGGRLEYAPGKTGGSVFRVTLPRA